MIKITAKKETLKGKIKGDSDTIALELVHATVRLVEHLISMNKEAGYAAGATIIEILQKMIPEHKEMREQAEENEESGDKE